VTAYPDEFDDDPDAIDAATLTERSAKLQAQSDAAAAQPCCRCGTALCGHEALLTVVFGCRTAPRCSRCLAAEQHEDRAALLQRALAWIERRDCFLHVWRTASSREGTIGGDRPSCLPFAATAVQAASATTPTPAPAADAAYDAGDLGCGDLVLELRFRLKELPPGAVLAVTARDPAAPVDLPAWCGLCGHTLVHAAHPHYWIQKKRDRS
jgi:tRNA 2-thiouridine synthesizing protein A